ncbi:hypothetical protein [Actinoallomurus oryzae]|uniref:hypothetical protein n=1 Tax=Actinoallomurus oryzae TaxID=502180 RepID=UPI0031F0A6FB
MQVDRQAGKLAHERIGRWDQPQQSRVAHRSMQRYRPCPSRPGGFRVRFLGYPVFGFHLAGVRHDMDLVTRGRQNMSVPIRIDANAALDGRILAHDGNAQCPPILSGE